MALIFFQTPEEPVQCAMEIARALKNHPQIRLRMGVHSGPIDQVKDVNDRLNVAGAGINMAQRVMACGDVGHILLSKRVADDLAQDKLWQPYLHELGEIELKHGRKLGIVNLYSEEIGNPKVPEKVKGPSRQPAERPVRVGWPPLIKIAALLLVCLLAAIAAIILLRHRGTYLPSTQTLTSPAAVRETSVAEKSIAVLPFENLSHDPDNAYFADGIQEEILARLARIADLKVISRTSTQHYKSSPDNLPQIAKRLGVANILEGSVQKSADKARVNVELIRAATDSHLWADTFDRKLTDVFAIESEVARTIADTLQAKLTGAERNAIAAQPTENTEAYQLYLKGRFFWNKRTGENLKKAADYFNQAVAADPKYALAYAGLADAYALMPIYGPVAPRDCSPKAKAAAAKALELDDGLAEAHTSLAQVLFYDLDFSQATREFQRAIELNPNYAAAHQWFGSNLLSALGRFDEAIAETKRALELDPLSLIINAEIGRSYIYARRFDESIDQLRKTIELDSNFYTAHWDLGEALEAKGLIDAAIAEYEKVRELTGNPQIAGFLGHAYAVRGQRDEALKMLAQLKDESTRGYVPAYCFAIVNLGLGDKDEALRWLEKDFDDRDPQIGFIKVNPALDPLRGDPRFEALVAKVFWHKDATSGATTPSP